VENEPVQRVDQADEWHTTRLRWSFGQHHSPASGLDYHDVLVLIHRRRVPGYYLAKALYPTAVRGLLSTTIIIIIIIILISPHRLIISSSRHPVISSHRQVCGLLSTAALIVPAAELAGRFGILLTLFLTVFAIQWITNDKLPKTAFLTKLDRQIGATLLFIIRPPPPPPPPPPPSSPRDGRLGGPPRFSQ
jgi:hypothetical protein